MKGAALFAALAVLTPVWAHAQNGQSSIAISDAQAAQLLIANGRYDEAKKLLERDLAAKPDDSETLFLLATIATAQKDYDAAISIYRRILVHEPDAERVRLELARVFFSKAIMTMPSANSALPALATFPIPSSPTSTVFCRRSIACANGDSISPSRWRQTPMRMPARPSTR